MLSACGISIDRQLTQVDGRVLEAPKVHIDYLRLRVRLMREVATFVLWPSSMVK